MSYQSEKKQRLLAEKTRLENRLEMLNTTLDNFAEYENYKWKYDSGEGSQSVTRFTHAELQNQLDRTESRLESVCQKLAGLVDISAESN